MGTAAGGVGIFSFARYGSDFYSSSYEGKVKKALQKKSSSDYSVFDDYYIPAVTSVLLLRSCKCLLDWGREWDGITCRCARNDQDGLTTVNISFIFVLGNRLKTSDRTNRFC